MAGLTNEEIATRIMKVYFREIARLGYKRRLSLDEVINAYYYTLSRLRDKQSISRELLRKVEAEEKQLRKETREEITLEAKPKAEANSAPACGIVETETIEETREETSRS